jgi:hypothetical protein
MALQRNTIQKFRIKKNIRNTRIYTKVSLCDFKWCLWVEKLAVIFGCVTNSDTYWYSTPSPASRPKFSRPHQTVTTIAATSSFTPRRPRITSRRPPSHRSNEQIARSYHIALHIPCLKALSTPGRSTRSHRIAPDILYVDGHIAFFTPTWPNCRLHET